MSTIIKMIGVLLISCFAGTSAAGQSLDNLPKEWTYAIEISGVLCGYAESEIETIETDGVERISMKDNVLVRLSVLGGGVDMTIENNILVDPVSLNPVSIERAISTTAELYSKAVFGDGCVWFTDARDGEAKKIDLEEEVILENTINYPHLMKDFIRGNETEKSYRVFDDNRGLVAEKTYTKIGTEEIELAGKKYQTTVLEELNKTLGVTIKFWLDNKNSCPLKMDIAGTRLLYLADKSVKKQIRTVNLESTLFAKVDKVISNVPDISFMKVKATILSGGEWITPENLNFPGQKFEGTVTNNLVEGVFEIEPVRYSGENAPPFPYNPTDENLQKYLGPESLIESDHPDLIAEAKHITKGSKNAWEAAVRLSTWVGENIHGAVPGGTSAINTYNTREGECGSHSRLLAAFCRAMGIPARLSVGCMYVPYLGGSFGQHAWTEVYMGKAGWVAVDATANEFDFVDAGHIRLGEKTSFNPRQMKILEYRMGNETATTGVPEELKKYIGKYQQTGQNNTFEILYQGGSLAIDIPGAQVLALNPPDENGVLFPKLTRQVNFSFENDIYGNVARMKLKQVVPLGKTSGQDSVGVDVPENLRPLVGNYRLAQAQADFKVVYADGMLAIDDPLAKQVVKLPEQNEAGLWKDEFNKNEIEFVKNDKGEVIRMLIYSNIYLKKITNSQASNNK